MRTVGERIELLHAIGEGGCATVWLGRHRDTGALVAVKLLEAGVENAAPAARFRREAEISARLTHRNLVRVFDYVHEPDGSAALVMEHLRGETLESVLERHGSLPVPAAVACIVAVLRGLEHAHERGVIHRDLKPSNVFLAVEPDGFVVPKVLDFGVAKEHDEQAILLTQQGHIVGTPAYMSPEQVRGEHVAPTSDVFSLGAMLYELLTGELAFRAPSPQAAMIAILERELEPHPNVPEPLWAVLQRALRKDPCARQASAAELRQALEECVEYTEQGAAEALQALAPVVAELPELPPRAPSRPSYTGSLRPVVGSTPPPSLSPVGVVRGKLWALGACAAVALLGATTMRAGTPPALATRTVLVRSTPPPAAEPPRAEKTAAEAGTAAGAVGTAAEVGTARAVVNEEPPASAGKRAAKSDRASSAPASAASTTAAPGAPTGRGSTGVDARARSVARTPGF